MMTLSLWVFGLLLISLTGASGLNHFPKNYVVGKKNGNATLTCSTGIVGDATWKHDGEELDDSDEVQQQGQNLIVLDVDVPTLGEYSCWVQEEMLSSTYLLLEPGEEEELDSLIKCSAKSYDCKFSCTLTNKGFTAVRLGLGDDCSEGGNSCLWVNKSSDQLQGEKIQFELSHSLSPYAEESTMLKLTAEAIKDLSIVRTIKRFYLRDIVEPDSPQIVRCEEMGKDLNVTIDPPSSWSTPHSFFVLEHQIEYELRDNGKTRYSSTGVVPKMINKLRVRSRDSLVLSSWSQWSPWKNVKTGGKHMCKCRDTTKYCCPEFPSGYFDRCEKRDQARRKKMPNKNVH